MDDIEETLRKAITDSGYGIRELARMAECHNSQIARFVTGERTITLPIASKICMVLGLTLTKSKK